MLFTQALLLEPLEQARLSVLIGLPQEQSIDAQVIANEPAADPDLATLEDAERTARMQRIEIAEIDKRIEQSGAEVKRAKWRSFRR